MLFNVVCNFHSVTLVPPTPIEVNILKINASSVTVVWRWNNSGPALNCFNTTTVTYHHEGGGESSQELSDPAATETILTGLQCNATYTITVVATAGGHRRESVARTVNLPRQGIPHWVYYCIHMFNLNLNGICTDLPHPIGVRAEATADNTSIRVSWQWLCKNLLTYLDLVQVRYKPEGGSLMVYTVGNTTVGNTTATSAFLSNLQCNTKYNITVYVESGSNKTGNTSVPMMISLPARGMYTH